MANLEMVVVEHPNVGGVKYSVPADDRSRWEAQGWKATGDRPTVPNQSDVPVPTAAQKAGIGPLPVADAAAPGREPSAVDVPAQAGEPGSDASPLWGDDE